MFAGLAVTDRYLSISLILLANIYSTDAKIVDPVCYYTYKTASTKKLVTTMLARKLPKSITVIIQSLSYHYQKAKTERSKFYHRI
jgi:hypothetical protein